MDDDAGADSGAAYVFDVHTKQQLHKLTASGAGPLVGLAVKSATVGGCVTVIAFVCVVVSEPAAFPTVRLTVYCPGVA